jgi:hypothetical protein
MMSTWKYIAFLIAAIAGVAGYAYADSEVRTVVVTAKTIQNVQMRRGRTAKRFILKTSQGDLPILKFPLIGYTTGVEDIYAAIVPGNSIKVRIAQWPPEILGDRGKPHILAVY